MSRENYVTEAMRQLNKEEHNRQLDQDPTLEYTTQLIQLLGEMKDHHSIDEETWKFLTPLHVTTALFYLQPKSHKPLTLTDQLCPHVGHQQRRFPNL